MSANIGREKKLLPSEDFEEPDIFILCCAALVSQLLLDSLFVTTMGHSSALQIRPVCRGCFLGPASTSVLEKCDPGEESSEREIPHTVFFQSEKNS